MHTPSTLALLAAFALAPAVAHADGPVVLKWSLKEGDTFYLKQTITREQTAESGGRKQDKKSEVTTVIRFKVTAARDGQSVMEMTYLDIQASAQGGRPQSIDPNSRFAGASMTVFVDGKQNVTKLEGHAAFLDKLSGGDKAARKLLEAVMSESTVRQIVSVMFVPTPEKPVKIGDSWTNTDCVRLGELGEMTTNSKLTLEGVKEGVATVGVGGAATLKMGGGGGALPLKVVKSDLKVETYKGRYEFDIWAGRPREFTTELLTTGTYTFESGGKETEIAIRQKQTTVIRISDRNPLDE